MVRRYRPIASRNDTAATATAHPSPPSLNSRKRPGASSTPPRTRLMNPPSSLATSILDLILVVQVVDHLAFCPGRQSTRADRSAARKSRPSG